MLAFSFFALFAHFAKFSITSKMPHSAKLVVWFFLFLFWDTSSCFPHPSAEAGVWQYNVQSLKLHLIVKTLLFVLILSKYWQIGVFTLVIEASCVPGGVLSILSGSPPTLHKPIFLSALNTFKTVHFKGGEVRKLEANWCRSWLVGLNI